MRKSGGESQISKQDLIDLIENRDNQMKAIKISMQFRTMYGRSWFSANEADRGIAQMQKSAVARLRKDLLKDDVSDEDVREINDEINSLTNQIEDGASCAKSLATVNIFGLLKFRKIKGVPHYRVRYDKVLALAEAWDKVESTKAK